jgi:hypothetical protein
MAFGLGIGTILAIAAVSAATPFLSDVYWQRWFAWPQVLFTAQVPLLVSIAAVVFFASLMRRHHYTPFLMTLLIFTLSLVGLGISLFPYVVPHHPPTGRIEALNNNWETLVRRGRGYRNHAYLFKKLRFITANPVRNSSGIKRFLALGLPVPATRAA